MYKPTHKSYTPYLRTNEVAKVLTDVNVSETTRINGRKELITRFYSLKNKDAGKWLLSGHAPRFVMTNAQFTVSEATRQKVLAANSKAPHAYMTGLVTDIICGEDDTAHESKLRDMLARGAVFIGYNPFKSGHYLVSPTEHLPTAAECEALQQITRASELYAYETGILAIL